VNGKRIVQGRSVGLEEVALIEDWLRAHPEGNRTRLSRYLCDRWGWRNHAGRPKDMACRSLLAKLERLGWIRLPPSQCPCANGQRNRHLGLLDHDSRPIECRLETLQPVRLELPSPGSAGADLVPFLLQRYHYLGHRNCVGENLKYLARDRHERPLACLLFGSAAWKAGARDQWIGWSPQQRARSLFLLTNNTRFLVVPWARVPGLASHLLGQVTARLSADWQRKYGHPIYLVETFVECERFAATCYRAAGWVRLGLTTGRTRNDDGLRPPAPLKSIYVKALCPDVPGRLRA